MGKGVFDKTGPRSDRAKYLGITNSPDNIYNVSKFIRFAITIFSLEQISAHDNLVLYQIRSSKIWATLSLSLAKSLGPRPVQALCWRRLKGGDQVVLSGSEYSWAL